MTVPRLNLFKAVQKQEAEQNPEKVEFTIQLEKSNEAGDIVIKSNFDMKKVEEKKNGYLAPPNTPVAKR